MNCGVFLFLEYFVLKGFDRRMGKIVVKFDVQNGLLGALDIEWRGNIYNQTLTIWAFHFVVFSTERLDIKTFKDSFL